MFNYNEDYDIERFKAGEITEQKLYNLQDEQTAFELFASVCIFAFIGTALIVAVIIS